MNDNWRELPAGNALDRLVAERLGLNPSIGSNYHGWFYVKDGTEYRIPAYSSDAAAPLPLAEGKILETAETWKGNFHARIVPFTSDKMDALNQSWQHADTLALARLRAWLAHDDEIRNGKDGE